MRRIIETSFGKQENRDVIINDIYLINVNALEEHIALNDGYSLYIEDQKEHWFMTRNTRVSLENNTFTPINLEWEIVDEQPKITKKILNAYLQHNEYSNLYALDEENKRFKYLIYKDKGKIVAITKLLYYLDDIEAYSFIWNYHKPNMRLGTSSLQHELWWAKEQGYKHMYIGSGYEKSSIYKASIPGFEWWTGMEWSKDTKKYEELCRRDSKIRSFKALTSLDLPELP